MTKERVGLLYLHIYQRLFEEFKEKKEATQEQAKLFLRNWRIPKVLRPIFLKELEQAKFIKIESARGKIYFIKYIREEINYFNYYRKLSLKN
jgi:hypothetical protein